MSFFFVQLADPQFGLFKSFNGRNPEELERWWRKGLRIFPTDVTDMSEETRRYTQTIEAINRLRPAFAITCGDLVQDRNDAEQHETLLGLTEMLDDDIPMRWVSGNHDVGVPPTPESIAAYQGRYGPDNYSFDHEGSHFVVINSSVCVDPSAAPGEWESIVDFLETDLAKARDANSDHIMLFTHHPLFVAFLDEADHMLNVPKARRQTIVDILMKYGATYAFAGHWHKNAYAEYGPLNIVASGAVGYPLGIDPSGLRIVKVYPDRVEHEYFGLDDIPETVTL